jgi:hypothetical protein
MGKTCEKGKSCKATCIGSNLRCKVDLPPKAAKPLSQIAEKIYLRSAPLKTPEQAVKWFESHKEQIALSGLGTKGSPDAQMMLIMIEPGGNPSVKQYGKDGKLSPNLGRLEKDLGEERPVVEKEWGGWYKDNLMFWVNDQRQEALLHIASGKQGIQGVQTDDVRRKYKNQDFESVTGDVRTLDMKRPFYRKMAKVAEGVGADKIFVQNLSPFGVPSDKYWPFADLPWKQTLGRDSVLSNRKSWLKYVGKVQADKILSEIEKHPRKLVWMSKGPEHTEMFKYLVNKTGSEVKEKTYEWVPEKGNKPVKLSLRYFRHNGTSYLSAPHPSYASWRDEDLEDISRTLAASG